MAKQVIEMAGPAPDDSDMGPTHDPRPASRYQAVSPSMFRDRLVSRERTADAPCVASTGARLLRVVPAQVVRIALGG